MYTTINTKADDNHYMYYKVLVTCKQAHEKIMRLRGCSPNILNILKSTNEQNKERHKNMSK